MECVVLPYCSENWVKCDKFSEIINSYKYFNIDYDMQCFTHIIETDKLSKTMSNFGRTKLIGLLFKRTKFLNHRYGRDSAKQLIIYFNSKHIMFSFLKDNGFTFANSYVIFIFNKSSKSV
jgi:hypothetical protein